MKIKRQTSTLFLALDIFKTTGGVQNVCKTYCKALSEEGGHVLPNRIMSIHDHNNQVDLRYTGTTMFKGFSGNRFRFVYNAIKDGLSSKIVIISHVNLLGIVMCIKILRPGKRCILIAHGIEVWRPFNSLKRYFLQNLIEIWCVSKYTKQVLCLNNNIQFDRVKVVNNCLDPYFKITMDFSKPENLLKKHGLYKNQPVLMTISRLADYEMNKGYRTILRILPQLLIDFPDLHYFLAGKAQAGELENIAQLVRDLKLESQVTVLGFIDESELVNYYRLSDVFILPSFKEGFGLVFIEAAACGCKVISGNRDGSRDAMLNGKLGTMVDPEDTIEIESAIKAAFQMERCPKKSSQIQELCLEHFSFQAFYKNITIELS
jgi:phosphatidylinositol alpha-1,6-mannosyltransferase